MKDVRHIGSRLELFIDDWLIDAMQGVTLKLHHPIPRETALDFDRPWEGPISSENVVIKDEGQYRLWYRAGGDDNHRTAYAESQDGIHWQRPDLGLFSFHGFTNNNILLEGSSAQSLCVFIDGKPGTPETERYKAIGIGDKFEDRATLRGFTSRDGIHWQMLEKDPMVVAPPDQRPWFDSHNVAFWDGVQNQYVAYMRGWIPPGVRSIRRSTSPDFRTWTEPEFIDLGNSPVEHLYKNSATPYFRAPHIYLMFPRRYFPQRKVYPEWPVGGISEAVFMTSRDGIHWDRRFMEAFLRPGPDPHNWTDRNMYIGVGVVPTGSAEMSVYFGEHFRHQSNRLRRGALRTDGFVSVNAPYAGGEFVTRPLTFSGEALALNYTTSAAGSLRVEIQDGTGQPLPGYSLSEFVELYGDEVERIAAWQHGTNVAALAGRPVRLRFMMQDADLYAIQFRPQQ